MIISCFIIPQYSFLNTLLCHFRCDMDAAILRSARRKYSQFNSIERPPCISSANISQKFERFLLDHGMITPKSLFPIGYGPQEKRFDIVFRKWVQFKNDRTGDQSPVHLKIRIFRGRPDQDHSAVLHKRQKIILLALIEPVDLIDKENGLSPVHACILLRLRHNRLHVLLSGCGSVDLQKLCLCRSRDDFR